MDSAEAVTHVSLCAGYGGIDLGLKRAITNLRTVAFNEIEAFAVANLVAKMEAGLLDAAPVWTDLKTFPWGQFRGKVDILSGGYPCQPFSAAGLRRGADDPRHLWPFIADGISRMEPAVCFFENVEGHISLGLQDVLRDLGSRGYTATWGIFSAAEVGAPHQRKRVFILAYKQHQGSQGWLQRWTDSQREGQQGHAGRCSASGGVWPSRPGQLQHGWEPPRVVGTVPQKLADFCARDQQQGHDTAPASGEGIAYGSKSADANADRGSGLCGGNPAVVGDTAGVQRNGGDDNSGSSERPEAVPQPRDAGREGAMGDADCRRLERSSAEPRRAKDVVGRNRKSTGRQAEPTLGGNADGPAGGMGYAELCVSCDNRTDELRLLGNGVVSQTAELAFKTLLLELKKTHNERAKHHHAGD